MELPKQTIEKACLAAIDWWVSNESNFHLQFKTIHEQELLEDLQNTFYNFTKLYSVRRTVREGKGIQATNKVLNQLVKNGFITEVNSNNSSAIDNYHKFNQYSIRSLVSKFATLIRPEAFTMYDIQAVKGLKSYSKKPIKNYSTFYQEFLILKENELPAMQEQINFYYENVLSRFKQSENCTLPIYEQRVLDKLLWYVGR